MKAELANLISKRHALSNDIRVDSDLRYIIQTIYPQISVMANRGMTNLIVYHNMNDATVKHFRELGYVVRHVGENGTVMIDWADQTFTEDGLTRTLSPAEYNKYLSEKEAKKERERTDLPFNCYGD